MNAQLMTHSQGLQSGNTGKQCSKLKLCLAAANWALLMTVQHMYVDLWNAKYKNKAQVENNNMGFYTA